jgi:hypothetical protein
VREIRMLRSTRRGLEPWHGRDGVTLANERASSTGNTNFDLNRRASPRPYLGERGAAMPRATRLSQRLCRWT